MRSTTIYKVAGTKFFRLASSKLWGKGGNLQNIEKSMRVIYEPDPGKILCQCDQSGADAFIMAKLLPKGNKLDEFFTYRIKPYSYMALVFTDQWEQTHPQVHALAKMPLSELATSKCWKDFAADVADSDNNPAATRYYYHYKQTVLSGMYDIHAPTFRLNLLEKSGGKVVLSQKQALYYLSGYHTLLPELRPWYHSIQEIVRKTKTLYNLFGHPMTFTGLINDSMMKEAYSAIPQGTVGTNTNIAYTNLQQYIEDNKLEWDLLNNTHDSYLTQCPIGEEIECCKQMKRFMNNELVSPATGERFNIRSECQVGGNWSPAKTPPKDADLENPEIINKYNLNGLKEIKC